MKKKDRLTQTAGWSVAALIIVIVFVLVAVVAAMPGGGTAKQEKPVTIRQDNAETAMDPNGLVKLIIDNAGARATADHSNGGITVAYQIDPWALMGWSGAKVCFEVHVGKLVPQMLTQFPDAEWIRINVSGVLMDERGNERRDLLLSAGFSRLNASTVNWDNVNSLDLDNIADEWFEYPGL